MAVTGVGNYNNIYEDLYASSRKEVIKKGEAKEAANAGISKANESKLSAKAQEFLKNLRSRYGDYDFMTGNSTDDLKTLLKSGNKEFSVVFSNAELERMANDEKYAKEKLHCMERAVKMSVEINQKFGFEQGFGKGDATAAKITKTGIVFKEDGTTSFFAELEKSSADQKERIEKAQEEKRTHIQADSMEELLEKMRTIDWSAVKSEKIPESGGRFDFSI